MSKMVDLSRLGSFSRMAFPAKSTTRLAHFGKKLVVRLGKISSQQCDRRVILCYHSVNPKTSFSTPPARFEEHLRWLSGHCHVEALVDIISGRSRATGRPHVAITFDDGYHDNHEYVFPLLQKYGLSATFFLTV